MSLPHRTVHIIDDDDAARDSLALLVESEEMTALAYASAQDFLSRLTPQTEGCIITDIRMPGIDGMQLIALLKERACRLPVVAISGHGDVATAVAAMKAGVHDFIEKPFNGAALIDVIQRCFQSLDETENLEATRASVLARMNSLSRREREVLDALVLGKSNKAIAAQLSLSPRTVEIYRANVMTKMKAPSLSDLVRMSLLIEQTR
jgi:two-component system response regulator FixJ